MKIHKVIGITPGSQQQASQQLRSFMLVLKDIIGSPNTVVYDCTGYVYSLQESSTANAPGLRNQEVGINQESGLTNGTHVGFAQYTYSGAYKGNCAQYNRSNTSTEGNMVLYYTKIKNGVLFCVTGGNTTSEFNYEHMAQALIRRNSDGHLIYLCSMPLRDPAKSDTLSQVSILDITSGARKYTTSDFDQYLITEGKAVEDISRASIAPFYVPDIGVIDGAYLPITLPKKQDKMFVFTLGDKEYISMAGFSGTQIPVFECEED